MLCSDAQFEMVPDEILTHGSFLLPLHLASELTASILSYNFSKLMIFPAKCEMSA